MNLLQFDFYYVYYIKYIYVIYIIYRYVGMVYIDNILMPCRLVQEMNVKRNNSGSLTTR